MPVLRLPLTLFAIIGRQDSPFVLTGSLVSAEMRSWTRLTTVLCLLIAFAAVLYKQATKGIPTRLRADQAPRSEFGVVRVDGFDSRSRAGGIE